MKSHLRTILLIALGSILVGAALGANPVAAPLGPVCPEPASYPAGVDA